MAQRHLTPEDPVEAGPSGTAGPTRTYENDEIRVLWDATRCIHVGNCLRALPAVFQVGRRPWVDVDAAPAAAVAEAVLTCPTGALRYETRGALPPEPAPEVTEVRVRPNGPLYVTGTFRILGPGGQVVAEEHRVALCRCGHSENPPFCDNSHRRARFRG